MRTAITDRYIADNKLNTEEVNSYENALKADQSQIIRNVSTQFADPDYDMANIDADLAKLRGISLDKVAPVHELAVGKLISDLDTNPASASISETAKLMRHEKYNEVYTDAEIKRAQIGIDSFGDRVNDYIDAAIPGASDKTKETLIANVKTRLGFEAIEARLDKRRTRLNTVDTFFKSKDYRDKSIGSLSALLTDEEYKGDEHVYLRDTAKNFINAALKKANDENTYKYSDNPDFDTSRTKEIARKAFSQAFDADVEEGEYDDWIFNSSEFGDDEIETEGIFSSTDVDLNAGTNTAAYLRFMKTFKALMHDAQLQLDSNVNKK